MIRLTAHWRACGLLQQIRRHGSAVHAHGSLRLELTRRLGAVELMHMDTGIGGSAESTGIQIWPAALILLRSIGLVVCTESDGHCVRYLENTSRILELGSGTGVVGITMACHGHSVTLSDTPHVKIPHYDVEGVYTGEARRPPSLLRYGILCRV
jgi:hypothetical protein